MSKVTVRIANKKGKPIYKSTLEAPNVEDIFRWAANELKHGYFEGERWETISLLIER